MYRPFRLFFCGGYLKSFQCIFRVNQMKCILVAPTNGPFKGGMVCSFHETRLEAFKMQCYLSNVFFRDTFYLLYPFFCFGIYAVVLFGLCCFSCFLKSFVCSRAEEAGAETAKLSGPCEVGARANFFRTEQTSNGSKLREINCRFHFPNRTREMFQYSSLVRSLSTNAR